MSTLIHAYKQFSSEVIATARVFYVWKGINNVVSNDPALHSLLQKNATTWNVILHSLQTTYLLALGRLFDGDDDAFSTDKLLCLCIENLDDFSTAALRQRKIDENGGNVPPWLGDFIKSTYQPSSKDFQKLRGEIGKQKRIYLRTYHPIRNKVIAHRDIVASSKREQMFKYTNISEIEEFLRITYQIEQIVFHLLYNGRLFSIDHFELHEEQNTLQDVRNLLEVLKAGQIV